MKQIDAKDVIKIINWISQSDEDGQTVLEPTLTDRGAYTCAIHLPLLQKTVVGIGNTKLESIDNATKESSKLIDEYLKCNPEFEAKELIKGHYILEEENGCLCIRLKQDNDDLC